MGFLGNIQRSPTVRGIQLFRIGGQMQILGTPPVGQAGSAYSFTFTGTGGVGSYTFDYDTLPSGWSLNATTGVLSHASSPAAAAGSFDVAVSMTDSQRTVVQKTYTIAIA